MTVIVDGLREHWNLLFTKLITVIVVVIIDGQCLSRISAKNLKMLDYLAVASSYQDYSCRDWAADKNYRIVSAFSLKLNGAWVEKE